MLLEAQKTPLTLGLENEQPKSSSKQSLILSLILGEYGSKVASLTGGFEEVFRLRGERKNFLMKIKDENT